MQRHFSAGVRTGAPMEFPGGAATPRAFAIALRLGPVAWLWNTPIGMEIVRNGGTSAQAQRAAQTESVQIVDVTRWALWAIGFCALITGANLARRTEPRR